MYGFLSFRDLQLHANDLSEGFFLPCAPCSAATMSSSIVSSASPSSLCLYCKKILHLCLIDTLTFAVVVGITVS